MNKSERLQQWIKFLQNDVRDSEFFHNGRVHVDDFRWVNPNDITKGIRPVRCDAVGWLPVIFPDHFDYVIEVRNGAISINIARKGYSLGGVSLLDQLRRFFRVGEDWELWLDSVIYCDEDFAVPEDEVTLTREEVIHGLEFIKPWRITPCDMTA